MDVRNFGGGTTAYFDAANTQGDGVSRVESMAGMESSPTAYDGGTLGLITGFTFSGNVPEPSSWTVLLGGIGLVAGGQYFRKKPGASG